MSANNQSFTFNLDYFCNKVNEFDCDIKSANVSKKTFLKHFEGKQPYIEMEDEIFHLPTRSYVEIACKFSVVMNPKLNDLDVLHIPMSLAYLYGLAGKDERKGNISTIPSIKGRVLVNKDVRIVKEMVVNCDSQYAPNAKNLAILFSTDCFSLKDNKLFNKHEVVSLTTDKEELITDLDIVPTNRHGHFNKSFIFVVGTTRMICNAVEPRSMRSPTKTSPVKTKAAKATKKVVPEEDDSGLVDFLTDNATRILQNKKYDVEEVLRDSLIKKMIQVETGNFDKKIYGVFLTADDEMDVRQYMSDVHKTIKKDEAAGCSTVNVTFIGLDYLAPAIESHNKYHDQVYVLLITEFSKLDNFENLIELMKKHNNIFIIALKNFRRTAHPEFCDSFKTAKVSCKEEQREYVISRFINVTGFNVNVDPEFLVELMEGMSVYQMEEMNKAAFIRAAAREGMQAIAEKRDPETQYVVIEESDFVKKYHEVTNTSDRNIHHAFRKGYAESQKKEKQARKTKK